MTDRTGTSVSVFLADDNLIVREGVRALLALESDLEVVGTASDYDELKSVCAKHGIEILGPPGIPQA